MFQSDSRRFEMPFSTPRFGGGQPRFFFFFNPAEMDDVFTQRSFQESEKEVIKPTSRKFLYSLPKFQYSSNFKKALIENKFLKELDKCCICYEDYDYDEEIIYLPCSHTFHYGCAKKWLEKRNTCCLCRHELPLDDEKEERQRVDNQKRSTLVKDDIQNLKTNEELVKVLSRLEWNPFLSESEYVRLEGMMVTYLLNTDAMKKSEERKELVKKIQFVLKRIDEIRETSVD